MPGSSARSSVLYIPAACVMLRGTQTCMPRTRLMMPAIGEPECQMPSSRCPRVRTITGHFCPPRERQRVGRVLRRDLGHAQRGVAVQVVAVGLVAFAQLLAAPCSGQLQLAVVIGPAEAGPYTHQCRRQNADRIAAVRRLDPAQLFVL